MEDNSNKKTKKSPNTYLTVAILLVVVLIAGVILLLLNGGGDEPQDQAVEVVIGEQGQVIEVYNPCADDQLEEKPLYCFTDTNYPLSFLSRFRSSPNSCWVAVDGYAYDVTSKPGGYEYPGPGGLDHLCGQDASERFATDSVPPPDREYLEGSVRQ